VTGADRWAEIRALFAELVETPFSARSARLAEIRGRDPDIADEVEALLRADQGEGIMERPLESWAGPLLSQRRPASEREGPAPAHSGSHAPEDRIGPYRIVSEAGRGGMGTVYVAERADGQYRRRVALKVVRDDLVAPGIVRRFLEERQILASLDHPGIAGLLEGGLTEEGAPWYAMEFVEGLRIDRWCDDRSLSLGRRIELFLDVCAAVSHAHGCLVLHRDLKPSNILVTPEGLVRLLDFGVGRFLAPTEGALGGASEATGTWARWLTPDYASPEQLRGGVTTTASDVYALGVLLHELLTGERPRVGVSGTQPVPPSTTIPVVSRIGASPDGSNPAERARLRGTTPQGLRRQLTGDLDAVVLQALQVDPADRYRTVEALAADLRAHLGGYPVSARGASRRYRLQRYLVRRRTPIAVATTFALAGVFFGITHTRGIAVERDLARAEAERAEEIATFIQELFAESDPLVAGAGPRSVQDFLASGAGRLRTELSTQPERRAALLRVIGKIYENLGEYADAEALMLDALEVRAAHLEPNHDLLLESIQDLGALRRRQGAYAEADSLLRRVLAARSNGSSHLRHAEALEELAELRRLEADLVSADSLNRKALELRTAAVGPRHRLVSNSLTALAIVARQRDDLATAERYHEEALAIRRELLGDDHAYVAESLRNLAIVLHAGARYAEARKLYEEALDIQLRVLGPRHPMVGLTRNSYGALLWAMDEPSVAAEQYELALELQRHALGPAHPRLATSISNAALTVLELGEFDRAEALAREGVEMRLSLLDPDHPSVATGRNVLAFVLRRIGRNEEAEVELREADRIYVERLGPDHPSVATNRSSLAFVRAALGDGPGAEDLFREALDIYGRLGRRDHPDAARTMRGLAAGLRARGHLDDAESLLSEAVSIYQTQLPSDHPDVAEAVAELRELLRLRGTDPVGPGG